MSYGIQIKNDNGEILVDSDFNHYHYAGKLTYYEKTRIPGIVDIKIPPRGQRNTNGMSIYQEPGDIFKYKLLVKDNASDFPPMAFINPQSTTGNVFAGIIKTTFINEGAGDYWDIWVLQDYNNIAPILYCFLPIQSMKQSFINDSLGGLSVTGLNEQGGSISQNLNFSGEILDSASINVGTNNVATYSSSNNSILPYDFNYPRRLYLEFSASSTLTNVLVNVEGIDDSNRSVSELNVNTHGNLSLTGGVFYTETFFKTIQQVRITNINPSQTITFKIGYSSNAITFGDRYGISTFNSYSRKTYDSRLKPLKIVGAGNAVSGTLPRNSAGSASGFNPDFRPSNSVEHTATLSSYQQNDMMYFIPSISHALLEQTREQSGDGTSGGGYDIRFYKYSRADFWWTFYRGTYRINDHTSTEHPYILTSGFSILGGGHVSDYDYEDANILGAIAIIGASAVLTFLTGGLAGAAIGAAISALIVSNSFSGVSSGSYYPYEQGSRNTGQNQTFLISRASYYD